MGWESTLCIRWWMMFVQAAIFPPDLEPDKEFQMKRTVWCDWWSSLLLEVLLVSSGRAGEMWHLLVGVRRKASFLTLLVQYVQTAVCITHCSLVQNKVRILHVHFLHDKRQWKYFKHVECDLRDVQHVQVLMVLFQDLRSSILWLEIKYQEYLLRSSSHTHTHPTTHRQGPPRCVLQGNC